MIIEKSGKAIRTKTETVSEDINYLADFYKRNGQFPLFSQVLIETRTDCNRRCSFCPQNHYKRSLQIMKWKVFTAIIDSLKNIEFGGRIALFVSNEPLLEARLCKMIKYAKKISPRFFLDITTNGMLLSLKIVDELFNSGLDNININDYHPDRSTCDTKISENLIPIIDAYRGNAKVSYKARSTNELLPNYAGVINQPFKDPINYFCNFPFRKLVISTEGNILLCCNDFKHRTEFGNILENDLTHVWYSQQMNQYRFSLLKGNRTGLCHECDDYQDYSTF